MKVWDHNQRETQRVFILKNCAAHLHKELIDYAIQPINKNPERESQLLTIIAKLNARIKRAEVNLAKGAQIVMDFTKKKRERKIMNRKMFVKVTK